MCTYIHNIHTHGCCDLSLTCYSKMFKVTQIRRLRLLFDHAICTNVMSIGNDKVLSMQCAQYSYRRMLWPIVDLLFHNVHLLQQAAAAPSCPARAQPKQISCTSSFTIHNFANLHSVSVFIFCLCLCIYIFSLNVHLFFVHLTYQQLWKLVVSQLKPISTLNAVYNLSMYLNVKSCE